MTVTNDGATILKMLDVEHPAGKMLVELADLQDQEVGDGTTSVVIIASELLRVADELVRNKIHPTSVISGFRLAQKEAVKYIQVCAIAQRCACMELMAIRLQIFALSIINFDILLLLQPPHPPIS